MEMGENGNGGKCKLGKYKWGKMKMEKNGNKGK